MAFFDNNVAVHGIVASSEGFSLTKNNYNVAKIFGPTFLYGDSRINSTYGGLNTTVLALPNTDFKNEGYVRIKAYNDASIFSSNGHIDMVGRIKLSNVSYGTDMPSTENAKEGQIYFRIID